MCGPGYRVVKQHQQPHIPSLGLQEWNDDWDKANGPCSTNGVKLLWE